jgi:hypothetical protein
MAMFLCLLSAAKSGTRRQTLPFLKESTEMTATYCTQKLLRAV